MKRGKFIDNQFASPFPYIRLTAIRQEHVARLSRFPDRGTPLLDGVADDSTYQDILMQKFE
jgi:hypothetical protein